MYWPEVSHGHEWALAFMFVLIVICSVGAYLESKLEDDDGWDDWDDEPARPFDQERD